MSFDKFPLGELCEILDTRRKPITKSNRIKGEYPYYGATGIVDYVRDYIFDEKLVLIGEDGAKWDSGEKTAFIADGKYWVNNHAHVVKPKRKIILDEWMVYFFFYKDLNEFVTGVTVPKLNQEKLKSIPIPLPPLPIQQKIVAKLDKIFAEIDKAYELLNKKIKNITFLRESFLEKKLKKINSNEEISIDEFCYTTDFVANGSFASLAANVKYLDEEDYAILVRLTDYRKNFKSKLKYLTKKSYDFLKHSKLFEGDLVLTNVGAYCGTPFLIPKLNKPATLGPNAILIRPKKEIMSSEFLKIFFQSRKGQNLLEVISNGTSHKKFNKTSLRRLKITVPTIEQQSKILDEINNLNNRIRIIEQNTENNLKNFEFLKQSILQQAFNGELVKAA